MSQSLSSDDFFLLRYFVKRTDDQFDVAFCFHVLFLYSEHFSEAFHVKSVLEMCRIAHDIRIFPILELDQSS